MRTKEQIDKYLEIEKKFKEDDSLDIICGMTREIEKMLDISIYMSADMSQGSSSRYVENDFFLLRPFKKCQYKKQAEEMQQRLSNDGVKVDLASEMLPMIAYLQRLGIDIRDADPEELKGN